MACSLHPEICSAIAMLTKTKASPAVVQQFLHDRIAKSLMIGAATALGSRAMRSETTGPAFANRKNAERAKKSDRRERVENIVGREGGWSRQIAWGGNAARSCLFYILSWRRSGADKYS